MARIQAVHQKRCPVRQDKAAKCKCANGSSWRVFVDVPGQRTITKQFRKQADAKAWAVDAEAAKQHGRLSAGRAPTIAELADQLVAGMRDGSIYSRRRRPYEPGTIDGYEAALDNDVKPVLGALRVNDHRVPGEVRRFIERLQRTDRGIGGGRVRNIVMPLRVVFARAVDDGVITANPMQNISRHLPDPTLATSRSRPPRGGVTPEQIEQLLGPLTPLDRAVWGLAFYAGLRLGEMRGLRWCDVDYTAGLIHVRRAFDEKARVMKGPKYGSVREVALIPALRELLMEQYLACDQPDQDAPVTPGRRGGVITYKAIYTRRAKAWANLDGMPARPLTLHEARHVFETLGHAAGWTLKVSRTGRPQARVAGSRHSTPTRPCRAHMRMRP